MNDFPAGFLAPGAGAVNCSQRNSKIQTIPATMKMIYLSLF
jgi:hypothetical protein